MTRSRKRGGTQPVEHRYVVIEDDADVAELLRSVLRDHERQATVDTFPGLPPLDEIAHPPPRAIVLDLTLGGQVVGLVLFNEIRTFAPLAGVPVLICTASQREAARLRARALPNVGVVTKPFSLDEFIGALGALEAWSESVPVVVQAMPQAARGERRRPLS